MKKTLKIIANVIIWLFVAFAVLITVLIFTSQQSDSGLPTLMGKRMVNILSNSMEPTFSENDLVLIDTMTVEETHSLKEGDIISYYVDLNNDQNDEINTHRIVESYEKDGYTYYITKGDNNDANDLPITSNKVLGVYSGTHFGGLGKFMRFMQTTTGFLCVIVIPLVLFFLYELYNFISVIVKLKGNKVSVEDEERIKQEAIEEYLRRQAETKGTPDNAPEAVLETVPESEEPADPSDGTKE